MSSKVYIYILLILCCNDIFAQVTVTPNIDHYRNNEKVNKFSKYEKSKTIFILPDFFEKESFQKVLKSVWKVTPYEVIDNKDFKLINYSNGQYSFMRLGYSNRRDLRSICMMWSMFSGKKIQHTKRLINDDLSFLRYHDSIAHISFFSLKGAHKIINKNHKQISKELYQKESICTNLKLGYLKNYFQQINNFFKLKIEFQSKKNIIDPELKMLRNHILYVPDYLVGVNKKMNKFNYEKEYGKFKKIFSKYEYAYKVQKNDVINDRILDNEEFYYLLYTIVEDNKYLQIVNSKTGKIIYQKNTFVINNNLKKKDILDINKALKK